MAKKIKKECFWQNLLKKEIPFCCNWTKPAVALYKMFFALILVFVLLFSIVYAYLWYYANHLKTEGSYLALLNKINQNFYYSEDAFVGVLQDLSDDCLFLQPTSVNAVLKVKYNDDIKVEKLIFSPALVEAGETIYPNDVYKVKGNLNDINEGDILYIDDLYEDDDGYEARSILIIGYDELRIPEF